MRPSQPLLRRQFLARAAAGAGALALAGCDALSRTEWFPRILGSAETLTRSAQRLLLPRKALAQEFAESDRSPFFRSNGTAMPRNPQYLAMAASGFESYRLEVGGLVDKTASLSLAQVREL